MGKIKKLVKPTIQQQLKRRNDCYYGLSGLRCCLVGDKTAYRILGADDWCGGCLKLLIVPAEQHDAYHAAEDAECVRLGGTDTGIGILMSAAVLLKVDFAALHQRFGVIETTADKVSLSEPWPHVCC
jgi:hypothetical protein